MNQIENNTLIHIGNILNTKGIKGEIVFNVLVKNIFIPTDSKIKIGYSKHFCKEYTIRQDINTNSIYSSLLLKEIDNKEKAIELKEQGLFIERNTILKYNPSIVLPDEIIGSKIINNDTDEFIGIVKEYWHLPANDVLLVDTNDGEIPIPYIDDVIKDINIKNRIIKIFLLDGLMELKTKKNKNNCKILKMRIDIISAVPESMISFLESSILANAQNKKIVEIFLHNLHDYADDKFKHIDDYPYGGGSGMLIKCKPVFDCIEFLLKERKYNEIIFMTPDAPILTQDTSKELALLENIIIIAGHYKGIDQRIRDVYITKEISIGDYVLSGGELPALVLIDSIVRLLPGVLNNSESALSDSLMDGFLESPQYTRPAKFRDLEVPSILLSGDHKKISEWKIQKSIEKTELIRPDLLNK